MSSEAKRILPSTSRLKRARESGDCSLNKDLRRVPKKFRNISFSECKAEEHGDGSGADSSAKELTPSPDCESNRQKSSTRPTLNPTGNLDSLEECKDVYTDPSLRSTINTALVSFLWERSEDFLCYTTLEILSSNASVSGYSFSKAYCHVKRSSKGYALASLFEKGIDILCNFAKKGELPTNKQEQFVLDRLLHFMRNLSESNPDKADPLDASNLRKLSETDLTIVLANHFFGKLATSPDFVIDLQCKNKEDKNCPCSGVVGKPCNLTGEFGDTSIGNKDVWHGSLDIIINNAALQHCPSDTETDNTDESFDNSPGRKSPVEVKTKEVNLQLNQHIIAETIVFSFLQKSRHPESDHFLFPCIGVTSENLVFYFYDSDNDVLLESCLCPLHYGRLNIRKFNVVAIIISWLVLNYKYLCTGLMDGMEKHKAGFFREAKSKLDIYKNHVKRGDVRYEQSVEKSVTDLPKDLTEDQVFQRLFLAWEKH